MTLQISFCCTVVLSTNVLKDLKSLIQVFSMQKMVILPVLLLVKFNFLMTCEFDVFMYPSGSHVARVIYLMNYPHYLPWSVFLQLILILNASV